jgi:hypothetical protein
VQVYVPPPTVPALPNHQFFKETGAGMIEHAAARHAFGAQVGR